MATLWDVITANSTLPVQAGNTFWDHMNAQAGGGVIFINGLDVKVEEPVVKVSIDHTDIVVNVDSDISVKIEDTVIGVKVDNDVNITIDDNIDVTIG